MTDATRFEQGEWTAQTVNQTVNNYTRLDNLSTEDKVNLIAEKIIGTRWSNEPGILESLRTMKAHDDAISRRVDRLEMFLVVTNLVMVLEAAGIVFLLLRVL